MSEVVSIPEEEDAVSEAPKKNKPLSWLLRGVGVFVITMGVLLIVTYFVLRSGGLTQSAVPKLKPYLAPFGIQLHKIGLFRLDLLKSVELKDFQLGWRDPAVGEVDLSIGEFKVAYSLADLLDQRAEIRHMQLSDVEITAHMLASEPAQVLAKPKKEAPLDMAAIEKLLSSPPLLLSAKGLELKNIRLNITLDQADGVVKYRGTIANTQLELGWTPDALTGLFALSLGEPAEYNEFILQRRINEENIELKAKPAISIHSQWHLKNSENDWQLKNTFLNFSGKLNDVVFLQGDQKKTFSLGAFDLQLSNSISSPRSSVIRKGLKNLFPLQLNTQLTSNALDVNISGFRQQNTVLNGHAEHHFNATVDASVNPLGQQLPEILFDVRHSLTFRDLQIQKASQTIKAPNVDWAFHAEGDTKNLSSSHSSFTIRLDADAKASEVMLDLPGIQATAPSVKASMVPEVHFQGGATLATFDQPLANLVAQLKPDILISNFSAKISEGKQTGQYQVAESKVAMQIDYNPQQIKLDSAIALNNVTLPEVKKTFSLKDQGSLETDLSLRRAKLKHSITLDNNSLAKLSLAIDNRKKNLQIKHDFAIQLLPSLKAYHEAAGELARLGESQVRLTGQSNILHNAENAQTADFSLLESWPVETSGLLQLTQYQPPSRDDGVTLSGPLLLKYSIDNKENYQIDFDLATNGILTPPLETPLPFRLLSRNNLTWPLSTIQSTTNLEIENEPVLEMTIEMLDKSKFLGLVADVSANLNPKWQVYLKDLKPVETIGALNTHFILDAKVNHNYAGLLSFDPQKLDHVSADVSLNTVLSQNATTPGSLLLLPEKAEIKQRLNWSRNGLKWQSQLSVSDMTLQEFVRLSHLNSKIELKANSGLAPDNAELNVQIDEGIIDLLSKDPGGSSLRAGHMLTPLTLSGVASWTEKVLNLKTFQLNLGNDLLILQTFGSASLDGKNAQIDVDIRSHLCDNLIDKPRVSGSGKVQMPLRLTLLEGQQLALEGEMKFDNLNLSMDDFAVQNVNGTLALEEELLLHDDNASFRYLLDPNPFQRVDFSRIQPYLNTSSLSIEKISTKDVSIGPVLASVLFKQNLFSLQQFDADLFSGHSAGKFYLDVRPGAWKLGVLSRNTNIDLRRLLGQDSKLKNSKLSPVNSRAAIEFDIHQRLMEGEIVVSQISRDQLLQLLDIVDPKHEDEQMAQLRKGLRFSHPKRIEISMQRGLMDLKVKIAGLAKIIKVTGLPLTAIIQQNTADLFDTIDQLPLE